MVLRVILFTSPMLFIYFVGSSATERNTIIHLVFLLRIGSQ